MLCYVLFIILEHINWRTLCACVVSMYVDCSISWWLCCRTDGAEDQYSVLINFDTQSSTDSFYKHFNGKQFSSLEVLISFILLNLVWCFPLARWLNFIVITDWRFGAGGCLPCPFCGRGALHWIDWACTYLSYKLGWATYMPSMSWYA